jgi:uncharacterized protein (DUF488 family)
LATLFTIGFTKRSAESFFDTLKDANISRLVDTRLNNRSQLAGFSKADDLRFFTETILGVPYEHRLELAPTAKLLDSFKKEGGSWSDYERAFLGLIRERSIQQTLPLDLMDRACLLCSEHLADHCHRRLVAEYLSSHWPQLSVVHL